MFFLQLLWTSLASLKACHVYCQAVYMSLSDTIEARKRDDALKYMLTVLAVFSSADICLCTGLRPVSERTFSVLGSLCWLHCPCFCPAERWRPFLCGVQQWWLCSFQSISHDNAPSAGLCAPSSICELDHVPLECSMAQICKHFISFKAIPTYTLCPDTKRMVSMELF